MNNHITYHLHSELSLLDSCTNYKLYVDRAKELGQKAICFTEHGNIYSWLEKKLYCKENDIKYIHGVEIYLTETLEPKVRDNYHTILMAKNFDGFKEINKLIDISTQPDHFYYKPRISFDEFLNISDNIISTSACLASPLNRLDEENEYYERLLNKYSFLEIQAHISEDQKEYNYKLYELSKAYNKKLIAGTDTHSIGEYKSECRSILQKAKKIEYTGEDKFDLTYKSYEELVKMFAVQDTLPEDVYLQAIENTNVMADSVEEFELDSSFKYPVLYENEEEVFLNRIKEKYEYKLKNNIITDNKKYLENIEEECRVFKKIGMIGFMLFMSELMTWCRESNIPYGNCRGSVGGSTIAYILDIIDLDPIVWGTVFSRFANEDRIEIGDIDVDISPSQRELVYQYIIDRFGSDYTSYILAIGTVSDKGTIDEIGRALNIPLSEVAKIKEEYESNPTQAAINYPNVFYYFDGLINTVVSQSMHPAGIIASPISLPDNYGTFWNNGKRILCINMEEVHEVSLVKYDILGLKNIEIIKDTCELLNIKYPLSHEINWNDEDVWHDIISSPVGVFQFEGSFAFSLLKRFKPIRINDMSLVNACLRPSGASYRDRLIAREFNHNPSKQIDELLKENNGFLTYQEDTLKFLQNICGLSGSVADNVRRAIGRKQKDRLDAALPEILEGYCSVSDKPREIAEEEAKVFLKIIEDSSDYQFGYNHSTGYSMIGYLCGYFRYYHPLEFITAYLNNAKDQSDIDSGAELAKQKGIKIQPVKFKHSKKRYFPSEETNSIYKGLSSIKGFGKKLDLSEILYEFRDNKYEYFSEFLKDVEEKTGIGKAKIKTLTQINYFDCFGGNKKLLNIHEHFYESKDKYSKKLKDKTKEDRFARIIEFEKTLEDEVLPIKEQIDLETEILGTPMSVYKVPRGVSYVVDLDLRNSPKIMAYGLSTGNLAEVKIYKRDYNKKQFGKGDIVQFKNMQKKQRVKFAGNNPEGKPIFEPISGEFDWWAMEFSKFDIDKLNLM